MAKGKVSVGSLFNQQHHISKSAIHNQKSVLAPRGGGITKAQRPNGGVFSKFTKPKKATEHPAYLSFAEATNNYRNATGVVRGQQLDPVYNALLARVNGLQVNGKPFQTSGMASRDQIDTLVQAHAALSKPLDDEQMTIQNHRQNGTVDMKEVKLGETMLSFERLAEKKRAELEKLVQNLQDVVDEIETAREVIVAKEKKGVKQAKKSFEAKLASLVDEAEAAREQARDEVKQARKEDREFKANLERKIELLFAELD